MHYMGKVCKGFLPTGNRRGRRPCAGNFASCMRRQGLDLRVVLALVALVVIAGGIALLTVGGSSARGRASRQAAGGKQADFDAQGLLSPVTRRPAAGASQLSRPAGQHRLLPGQGGARHVPVHQLSGHLPPDHLEPARRPEPDGTGGRLQSADHRRLGGPARGHAQGGRGVPRTPRDDRTHAVPDRLCSRTRARVEGVGGRLRTGRASSRSSSTTRA